MHHAAGDHQCNSVSLLGSLAPQLGGFLACLLDLARLVEECLECFECSRLDWHGDGPVLLHRLLGEHADL